MIHNNKSWIWANWPAPSHVKAGTSTRNGGYSQSTYATLNLSTHVGDNQMHVQQNRAYLTSVLTSSNPYWLTQTHSNRMVCLDNVPEDLHADAAHTIKKNVICMVMTADCVPLLFCDTQGNQIAAVHAGWKGISNGIIENVSALYPHPSELMIWIGPCICAKHYNVSQNVYNAYPDYIQSDNNIFIPIDKTHWYLNLSKLVKKILKQCGINLIYESKLCTYEQTMLFYSYRRDGGNTGRIASMIWMEA